MSESYKKAGVDLNSGYEVVKRIKSSVLKTKCLGVIGNIGGFGGLFDLSCLNYQEPVLVSGTDGVGTKLLIATMMDKHDTIGIDLVAMCVNDVITLGAKPLFFLDYIALESTIPEKVERIVEGISKGCIEAGCALIGGETAEMPGMYHNNHYDLAGFTVGIVEKSKIVNKDNTLPGDVLIGLKSSGFHANGFSLIRKIIKEHKLVLDKYIDNLHMTLGEALLIPTKIYVKSVLAVLQEVQVTSMVHITGGGFDENIMRGVKKGLGVEIKKNAYEVPYLFSMFEQIGNITNRELYNVFNMGIGFVLIVRPEDVSKTLTILKNNNEEAYIIGKVTSNEGINII